MKRDLARIILLAALAALAHSALAQQADPSKNPKQAGKSPVRVFVLAGQSNMEGKAPNTLLDYQAEAPETKELFKHFRKDGGKLVVHSIRPVVMDILKILKFHQVLLIAKNERAALAAVKRG